MSAADDKMVTVDHVHKLNESPGHATNHAANPISTPASPTDQWLRGPSHDSKYVIDIISCLLMMRRIVPTSITRENKEWIFLQKFSASTAFDRIEQI